MSKQFVLAIVRANGTRWNVTLSNSRDVEPFVGKEGALGWIGTSVSVQRPVQALVYRPGSDALDEAWFYENGNRRKLDILTLPAPASDTKRGNW